jgi:hypothetical protein
MNEHPMTITTMIWLLFVMPAVVCFSAICAYFGLVKSRTVTHIGIRSGWLARIYGFFYLLFVFGGTAGFIFFIHSIAQLTYQKVSEALLYPFHFPIEISLFFMGMGVIMWLISKWAERKMLAQPPEKIPTPNMIRKYRLRVLAAAGLVFLCGLFSMTGWPIALTMLLLLIYSYGETIYEINLLRTGEPI